MQLVAQLAGQLGFEGAARFHHLCADLEAENSLVDHNEFLLCHKCVIDVAAVQAPQFRLVEILRVDLAGLRVLEVEAAFTVFRRTQLARLDRLVELLALGQAIACAVRVQRTARQVAVALHCLVGVRLRLRLELRIAALRVRSTLRWLALGAGQRGGLFVVRPALVLHGGPQVGLGLGKMLFQLVEARGTYSAAFVAVFDAALAAAFASLSASRC